MESELKIGDLMMFSPSLVGMIIDIWQPINGEYYYEIEWYEGKDTWTTSYTDNQAQYLKRNADDYINNIKWGMIQNK